jgi:hypothetical protein
MKANRAAAPDATIADRIVEIVVSIAAVTGRNASR